MSNHCRAVKSCIFLISTFLLSSTLLFANNLSITSVSLTNLDTSAATILVQLNISWANSWRDSLNYDAAWVFVKYSTAPTTGPWSHATLKTSGTNPSSFSQGRGTGLDIVVPTDKKGCFIQRSNLGSGSVSTTSIQLVWDYSFDGLSAATVSDGTTAVKVFGVEMVYIPAGGFYVGDGNTGSAGEFEYGSASSLPPAISSEGGISFQNASADAWYYNSGGNSPEFASAAVFNVSSSFPKGYNAFYLMKYEMTQGQYVGFLNTLTRAQQSNRVATTITGDTATNYYVMTNATAVTNRNTITCPSSGNGTINPITFSATSAIGAGRDNRATAYLSWMDVAAYTDWAALRPITEFEFEKACRGPIYPVTGEYAWGSTVITCPLKGCISGTEDGTETCITAGAQCECNGTSFITGDSGTGPLRSGIFATSSTTTRSTSGAGYYGNMDLSGTVAERVVTVGNSAGVAFSGTYGDGTLSSTSGYAGNATNLDWPGIDATSPDRGVTAATGSGFKGGHWSSTTASGQLVVSNRAAAAQTDSTRASTYGGRFARTAP